MANSWTLTGPSGSLAVTWPTSAPIVMRAEVVGMSELVIGRVDPVFRHFGSRTRFTLHHLLTAEDYDTALGDAYTLMRNLTGAPNTIDFMASLTGPNAYSKQVRIIDMQIEAFGQNGRGFRLAVNVEHATL